MEVAVTAAGVNFVDILNVLGRGSDDAMHDPELGVDFAGTVTAVGEGVISHRVGDREKNSPDRRRRLHAAWFAQQVSQGRTVALSGATCCALAISHRPTRQPQRPLYDHR
ncbi:hypothetical protein EF908_07940 [Streptomyces sp. WAC04770]|nr:hypothetical protein [Streptomyces sp. WAC04770]RST23958.1 hypothetical protein EF908_07940 [Streptomyces sp. WAC04770]